MLHQSSENRALRSLDPLEASGASRKHSNVWKARVCPFGIFAGSCGSLRNPVKVSKILDGSLHKFLAGNLRIPCWEVLSLALFPSSQVFFQVKSSDFQLGRNLGGKEFLSQARFGKDQENPREPHKTPPPSLPSPTTPTTTTKHNPVKTAQDPSNATAHSTITPQEPSKAPQHSRRTNKHGATFCRSSCAETRRLVVGLGRPQLRLTL